MIRNAALAAQSETVRKNSRPKWAMPLEIESFPASTLFAAVHESDLGTRLTSRDVRTHGEFWRVSGLFANLPRRKRRAAADPR